MDDTNIPELYSKMGKDYDYISDLVKGFPAKSADILKMSILETYGGYAVDSGIFFFRDLSFLENIWYDPNLAWRNQNRTPDALWFHFGNHTKKDPNGK